MKVWIDPDLCTSDGICSEICPDVFEPDENFVWVVKELPKYFPNLAEPKVFDGKTDAAPKGAKGLARIPEAMFDAVVEAAESCPGECIFIEED